MRPFLLLSLVLVACGGNIERVPDSTAESSSGSGASSSTGSTTGSGSGSGTSTGSKGASGTSSGAQCDGRPDCPPGYAQVKSCLPDSDCKALSACGETIVCEKALPPCEGPMPICDPGDTEVKSQSECLQDDAKCYSRTVCDYTIWCTGPTK